jgi:hypothetical protein
MNKEMDQSDWELPGRLSGELKGLYGQSPVVPREVDEAILRMAGHRMARQRRMRLMLRWAGAASAAAVVMLAVWLMPRGSAPLQTRQVNILDAFEVARAIDHHQPLKKQWDVNHDGVVDQKDVDWMAQQAVRLKPEERS